MKQKEKSFGKLFLKNLWENTKILALASPLLISTNLTTYWGNPINSQKQLDSLIISESERLGLDSKKISAKFGETPNPQGIPYKSNPHTAYVHQLENGNYEIILDLIKTKNVLQHELYHIYDYVPTDKLKKNSFFKILANELQANFYSTTGIKTSLKHQ